MSGAIPKAVKALPAALKDPIIRGQRAAGKELAGTGAFVLDLPLSLVPPLKRGASYVSNQVATGLEKADLAVGELASKVPVVGKAFKGRKSYPVSHMPGDVTLMADIPVARGSEPVRKASRLGVPILAFMGADQLMNPKKESEMAEGKRADAPGCGHEHLLLEAASKIQELQAINEAAVEKIANLELEKKANTLVDRMVQEGVLSDDQRPEKVAELLSGNTKIAVVEEALNMGLQPPSIPRIGTLSRSGVEGEEVSPDSDDDMNETTIRLLNL